MTTPLTDDLLKSLHEPMEGEPLLAAITAALDGKRPDDDTLTYSAKVYGMAMRVLAAMLVRKTAFLADLNTGMPIVPKLDEDGELTNLPEPVISHLRTGATIIGLGRIDDSHTHLFHDSKFLLDTLADINDSDYEGKMTYARRAYDHIIRGQRVVTDDGRTTAPDAD
jgi:hypothetical protein